MNFVSAIPFPFIYVALPGRTECSYAYFLHALSINHVGQTRSYRSTVLGQQYLWACFCDIWAARVTPKSTQKSTGTDQLDPRQKSPGLIAHIPVSGPVHPSRLMLRFLDSGSLRSRHDTLQSRIGVARRPHRCLAPGSRASDNDRLSRRETPCTLLMANMFRIDSAMCAVTV